MQPILTTKFAEYSCQAQIFNTLRPEQNGHHVADNISSAFFYSKLQYLDSNFIAVCSHLGLIDNALALVQVMAWCPSGNKPLSDPMLTQLTHICINQPQCVNEINKNKAQYHSFFLH